MDVGWLEGRVAMTWAGDHFHWGKNHHFRVHTCYSWDSGKVIRVANRGQWNSLHCIASEWLSGHLGTLLHCCRSKCFYHKQAQTQTNTLMLFSKGNIYVLSQCLTYPEMEANGSNWYIGQPGVSKCIHIYLICRQKCWKRIQSPNCFSCWWAKGWGGLSETVTKDQSIQGQWNGYFQRDGHFQIVKNICRWIVK